MTKRKKRHGRSERCQEIIQKATEESLALVDPADDEDAVANFKSIHAICAKLVVAEGLSSEPTYGLIASYGERIYGAFIKPQTIKNRYRRMVAVWRKAYTSLVETTSESEWTDFSKVTPRHDSQPLNTETILQETIRRLQVENSRLRAQLKDNAVAVPIAPAPSPNVAASHDVPDILDVTPVRQWISRLKDENSLLIESPTGLKLNKNARIGMTIMDGAVLKVVKSL
ncbi:hypothetical protein [Rhizobium laguerreae]|uniref:hypothetical protein n=1 Tax=Rhizobium laguerreae TaxID=1076926 RepID=UPI001C8FB194|nr:hypothetical protein [Rhizobium laguerreae]MBY3369063.1 hypothetical protein [Rhizobium laguerreae]